MITKNMMTKTVIKNDNDNENGNSKKKVIIRTVGLMIMIRMIMVITTKIRADDRYSFVIIIVIIIRAIMTIISYDFYHMIAVNWSNCSPLIPYRYCFIKWIVFNLHILTLDFLACDFPTFDCCKMFKSR